MTGLFVLCHWHDTHLPTADPAILALLTILNFLCRTADEKAIYSVGVDCARSRSSFSIVSSDGIAILLLVIMESHAKQTRFALQPGLQQDQVFEIFDGDFGEVLQNGFPRDQVFDSLHSDPNSLVRHEPKQGEVFEMLDGNISDLIQRESQHDHTFDISHGDINRTIGYADHVPWEASGLVYRLCEPSFLASQAPKNPNDQEWRDIKPVFERLYSTENRTLKDVRTILERDRGFVARYNPSAKLLQFSLLTGC